MSLLFQRHQPNNLPFFPESARRRKAPHRGLVRRFLPYLLKSGCQWRMLPADFPLATCYKTSQWSERPDPAKYSILEQVLKTIELARPGEAMVGKNGPALYRGLPEGQEHRQRRTRARTRAELSGSSATSPWTFRGCPMRSVTTARYPRAGFGHV